MVLLHANLYATYERPDLFSKKGEGVFALCNNSPSSDLAREQREVWLSTGSSVRK